jgi:osmotically-inducible protein OsmY
MPLFSNSQIADISVKVEKEGRTPGLAANSQNSDVFVTDQVRKALATDQNFNNIKVDTKDGVVTLTGVVTDEGVKASVGQKVANVPGVKSVDNKLEVNK